MNKITIARNARKVWMELSYNDGMLSLTDLKERTKLSERDICIALGWLAHEGKAEFSKHCGEIYASLGVNVYI